MTRRPTIYSSAFTASMFSVLFQVADNMAEAFIGLVNLGQLAWQAPAHSQHTRARMGLAPEQAPPLHGG